MSVLAEAPAARLTDRLRVRGSAFFALAAWASAWLALVPITLQVYSSAFFVNGLTPEILIKRSYIAWLHTRFGWDIIDALFAGVFLAFVLFVVVLLALETIAWALDLDRDDLPVASLGWAVRALPAVVLWSLAGLCIVVLSTIIAGGFPGSVIAASIPAVIGSLWWLAQPFFVLVPEPLRHNRPPVVWRPAWPGSQALMGTVLLLALSLGLDWAIDSAEVRAAISGSVAIAATAVLLIAALWPSSAFLYLWLNRAGSGDLRRNAGQIFSRRTLVSLLALDLRTIFLFAFVIAIPILVTTVLLVFFYPQIAQVNQQTGASFSWPVVAAIDAARWLANWWWALLPSATALLLIARGRLYSTMGLVRESG